MKKAVVKSKRKRKPRRVKPVEKRVYKRKKTGRFREKRFADVAVAEQESAGDTINPKLVYTDQWIEREAVKLLEFFDKDKNRFFLKDFAIKRGYPSLYLSKFASRNAVFEQAMERVADICESRLVHKMKGKALATFMLKMKFGYVARYDVTSGDKPVAVACVMFGEKENTEAQSEEHEEQ